MLVRNYYYSIQQEKLNDNILVLTDSIKAIPSNKLSWLHAIVKDELVENYESKTSKYAIPKWREKEFIKKYPNATHLDIYPEGYSYFKVNYVIVDGIKIKYRTEKELGDKLKTKFERYSEVPSIELGKEIVKTRNPEKDSIIVFNYVNIDQFRNLISDTVYQRHFFNTFSDDIGIYEFSEYQKVVEEGLKYSDSNKNRETEFQKEIDKYKVEISRLKGNELNNETIFSFLKWVAIIIGILLYPLRILIIMILWSIRIIKTPHNNV